MTAPSYSDRRRRLYRQLFEEYNSQYINYKKYYLASDELGRKGRKLGYFTTGIGGLLLILLSGIVAGSPPEIINTVTLALSALLAALSFAHVTTNWQATSNQYYNSGQIHQRLFQEFDYIIKMRLPDDSEDIEELEADCKQLLEEKNTLNESTAQLDSKWFKKLADEKT
jgi:hypothetical protein